MSNAKKNEAAERAAALVSRPPRTSATQRQSGGGAGAPRAKDVRLTTTLAPRRYRTLQTYCAEAAEELGAARIPHATVVRALIARLDTDPGLRAAITADIAAELDAD